LAGSPEPGQVRVIGWAFDRTSPATPMSIRAYVGGKLGQPEAEPYELGPAGQPRPDIAVSHPVAGGNHGFDVSFTVVKSRRQPVCVYAVDAGSGAEKPLGCRTIGIAVPLSLSHLKAGRRGLHLRLRCEWPAGTLCPGQILLRARVRVRTGRRHGRGPKTKVVTRAIARRGFMLTGERSHAFRVSLSRGGHLLTRGRTKLRAQLIVAIPGSRLTHAVTLRLPG
jgi:hypothetical protein